MEFFDPISWGNVVDTVWLDMQQPAFWLAVFQIIWIDILLAGDNAVVIALACRNLPPHLRKWGMILGAGVAILMRIGFTFIVSILMNVPLLKLAGGLALFYIAVKLLTPEDTEQEGEVHASERLWQAVRVIAIADIIMSLDNVIAIAAASKGNPVLFMFGLAASVPLIIAGAAIVMSLLTRYPILVWAGGALLGWIAGDVIATDPWIVGIITENIGAAYLHGVALAASFAGTIFVLFMGWWIRKRTYSNV